MKNYILIIALLTPFVTTSSLGQSDNGAVRSRGLDDLNVSVSQEFIDLGDVPVGETASTTITITNNEFFPVIINFFEGSNEDGTFSITNSDLIGRTIERFDPIQIEIIFSPEREENFNEQIIFGISGDDKTDQVSLFLSGRSGVGPDPRSPNTFSLTSPLDSANVQFTLLNIIDIPSVYFSWTPSPNAVSYDLHIEKEHTNSTEIYSVSEESTGVEFDFRDFIRIGGTIEDIEGTYSWKVVARNRYGSISSLVRKIEIIIDSKNPSFADEEFRIILRDEDLPFYNPFGVFNMPIDDYHLSDSVVFLIQPMEYPPNTGIYYVDDTGFFSGPTKDKGDFVDADFWSFIGISSNENLLFYPATGEGIYSCYSYGSQGLIALDFPTPEQSNNKGNYYNGDMAFTKYDNDSGLSVWLHRPGQDDQLLIDRNLVPDLSQYLDFDGSSVAVSTGPFNNPQSVWLRQSDGNLKQIVELGDPLPGVEGVTVRSLGDSGYLLNTIVYDDKVYMTANGPQGFGPNVLFSSDGESFDIIAETNTPVPGMPNYTLQSFWPVSVSENGIWVFAQVRRQSEYSPTSWLFKVKDGNWEKVVGSDQFFDGRPPLRIEVSKNGILGDNLVIKVVFSNYPRSMERSALYYNGSLPGIEAESDQLKPNLKIDQESENLTKISINTLPNRTYSLFSSEDFIDWESIGEAIPSNESDVLLWEVVRSEKNKYFKAEVNYRR